MARPLMEASALGAAAHSRRLAQYNNGYNNGYYGNGYYGYSCYNHSGCLAGAIIGSLVFFLIAVGLIVCLLVRMRRQRAAAAATPYPAQNVPYPDPYATGGQQPYGNQYGGNQAYPQQYPGNQPFPQPAAGFSGPPPPPNFSTAAEREAWEAEQYAKYGEAGLAQGYPVGGAGPSSGVQMTQLPNK